MFNKLESTGNPNVNKNGIIMRFWVTDYAPTHPLNQHFALSEK